MNRFADSLSPCRGSLVRTHTWQPAEVALYSLFGVTLASDIPFDDRLAPAQGPPHLTFTCRVPGAASSASACLERDAVYISPYRDAAGEPILRLYRFDGWELLHFPGVADFHVRADRIDCVLTSAASEPAAKIHLLGTVMAFWLERQGTPALHASAVVTDRGAVAFLSDAGAGKSALAAAFMREGQPLLTDDILPLDCGVDGVVARPGYPQMRFWPDQADHFLGYHDTLERVEPDGEKRRVTVPANVPVARDLPVAQDIPVAQDVPVAQDFSPAISNDRPDYPAAPVGSLGAFVNAPHPLVRFYVPQRGAGTAIMIEPMAWRDGVIELVRNTFAARIAQAMGWQERRLELLGKIAALVPMRRLQYPSGFEYLPRVREAILQDLQFRDLVI